MKHSKEKKIILASGSVDRKYLFEKIGIPFDIIVSDYEEDNKIDLPLNELVIFLAMGKLKSVKRKIEGDSSYINLKNGNFIIITADTVVSIDNKVIGKAQDKEEAFKILKILSGKVHKLITGVTIYDSESNHTVNFVNITDVRFNKLDDNDITNYLKHSNEYQGRAGAYSLGERAGLFIEKINGSPSNVIGIPMDKIYQTLRQFGVNLLTFPIEK